MAGIRRAHHEPIGFLLQHFPCVVLLGARQVGKSTLLRQVLPEAPFFDLERPRDHARITADPDFFLGEQSGTIILDEAQRAPELFEALRVHIDEQRQVNGRYLLSGSSSPTLLHEISETLAGRVAILEVNTLDLGEALSGRRSRLYSVLADGRFEELANLECRHDRDEVFDVCLHGGYPEPFLTRENKLVFDLWMENYFRTYVERDIRTLFPRLNNEAYRRFIQMLGFSSGKLINIADFARSLGVSQPTAHSYFQIAEGTFLWRQVTSFDRNPHKRATKMPKGYLRDTGLIHHLLDVGTMRQMRGHPDFGSIWEAFVCEQIIKGMQLTLRPFRFSHYRTRSGAEVDLIIENKQGIIPIEIKVGVTTTMRQLASLKSFVAENDCPVGLLVNNGDQIAQLTERIWQVPATCL